MDESDEQVEALQAAYSSEDHIRKVLDVFATYKNAMRTVNVDVVWTKAGGRASLNRSEVVAALKRLQELGFGTYTKGAHGYPSRFGFRPLRGPLWVALLAQGSDAEDLPDDPGELPGEESWESLEPGALEGWVDHKFRLRQDVEISFSLPGNLSSKEANRLSLWVKCIPLDGDVDEF